MYQFPHRVFRAQNPFSPASDLKASGEKAKEACHCKSGAMGTLLEKPASHSTLTCSPWWCSESFSGLAVRSRGFWSYREGPSPVFNSGDHTAPPVLPRTFSTPLLSTKISQPSFVSKGDTPGWSFRVQQYIGTPSFLRLQCYPWS